MAWQPKRWTTQQLEERRLTARRMLRRGHPSQAAVARRLDVSEASVSRWARRLHEAGGSTRGLKARPRTGRPSKLSPEQWQQVAGLVRAGARTCGFPHRALDTQARGAPHPPQLRGALPPQLLGGAPSPARPESSAATHPRRAA